MCAATVTTLVLVRTLFLGTGQLPIAYANVYPDVYCRNMELPACELAHHSALALFCTVTLP